jgi:transposase
LIVPSTISYWVRAKKEGKLSDFGKGQKSATDIEMELARVKRERAEEKNGA